MHRGIIAARLILRLPIAFAFFLPPFLAHRIAFVSSQIVARPLGFGQAFSPSQLTAGPLLIEVFKYLSVAQNGILDSFDL